MARHGFFYTFQKFNDADIHRMYIILAKLSIDLINIEFFGKTYDFFVKEKEEKNLRRQDTSIIEKICCKS